MNATPKRKGLLLVGGVFGAGIATVVVSAFTLFAGAGVAASKDKPHNVNPPVVIGPGEGVYARAQLDATAFACGVEVTYTPPAP